MEECSVTAGQSQLEFSTYWTDCTIEEAIHRGHELRRGKPVSLPPREYDVVNIDLDKSPGCRGRRKKSRKISKMRRRRRSVSPHCCCDSAVARRKRMDPAKYRVHCGMRIAELAMPSKRHCLETWRTKCHTLPAYMVDRLRKIVQDQKPVVQISDALYCFKRVCKRQKKPSKYEEKCDQHLDRKEKVQCLLSLLSGHDSAVLCAIFGHKIAKKLAVPMNVVLSPELQNIACVIWCDIACMLRPPKTKGIFTRNYKRFEEDIVMKITIWIAQILEDLKEKMLEDEIREFEDEVGPALDAVDEIVNNAIDRVLPEPDVNEPLPEDTEEVAEKSSSSSCGSNQYVEITIDRINIDGEAIIAENPDLKIVEEHSGEEQTGEEQSGEEHTSEEQTGEEQSGEEQTGDQQDYPDAPIEEDVAEQTDNNAAINTTQSQHSGEDVDTAQPPIHGSEDIDVGNNDIEPGDNISDPDGYGSDGGSDVDAPESHPPEEGEGDGNVPDTGTESTAELPPTEIQENEIVLPPSESQNNNITPPSESQDNNIAPPSESQEQIDKPPDGVTQTEDTTLPTDTKETGTDLPPELKDEGQQPNEIPGIPETEDNDPDVFADATDKGETDPAANEEDDSDKKVTFDQDVNDESTNGKKYGSDLNWKISIEHINFAMPNEHLLSDADETWPGELLMPVLRPSQSVSKSITSLGKIKEAEEPTETKKEPTEPTKEETDPSHIQLGDGPKQKEETPVASKIPEDGKALEEKQDTSKPRTSKDSTASRDSKGQKKTPRDERGSEGKKQPRRPSSITSSKRSSQGNKADPSKKLRPKPKKPIKEESSKKPKPQDTESTKTEPSVKDTDKDVKKIEKIKPDYRVNIQTAPIWINRNFNEPSCTCFQMTSKAEEIPRTNNNLVRRWCKDLEKGYENLKIWNDWVEKTTRTVTILQREIDQISGKAYCSERCSNKELMKLKRSIDRDAQMWKKLNLHTQERLRSYKRLYQKRNEKSCTSNYLICCSKAKL